jgi:hypothetical protein
MSKVPTEDMRWLRMRPRPNYRVAWWVSVSGQAKIWWGILAKNS